MADVVTVAFVDIERSTELLQRRGDVDGVAAVESLLTLVRERIEPYGGREVKALGDGIMLVFPTPRQAVTFAVATQRAAHGRTPRVRIGINTGEALHGDDDPVGETVHAASRIAARAAGGEVLVSDVVRQIVGATPGVRFVDRGRVKLRGFTDRWRLHAAVGSEVEAESAPVFGREAEIDVVDRLLRDAREGTGRTLVLEGEAGIGKTHLVATARARAAAAGMRVVEAGADELEHDRPGRILGGFATALGVALAEDSSSPAEGGSYGYAVIEAIGDALEDVAARQPVVLVAEDLQWADELSLRGLASLARRLAPLPVAFVLTLRPTPTPPRLAALLTATGPSAWCHRLGALDGAAIHALAVTMTGAPPGPRLTKRLHTAGGNPLYAIELLRAIDEVGALHVRAGVAEVDADGVPDSLRRTIVGRLAALPADTLDIVRVASLLGREFLLSELAAVVGRPVVEVAAQLRTPVEMALLSGDGDALVFRHDLIREAVADDIPAAIRRDLHVAAGHALAAAGAPAARVAGQFALGARPGDEVAADWLERAARDAVRFDAPTAVSLFEQAAELMSHDQERRDRIQIQLLEPLSACGRVAAARALAAALLDRCVTDELQFEARRAVAVVSAMGGDLFAAAAQNAATADLSAAPPEEAAVLRCLSRNMSLLTGASVDDVVPVAERARQDASTAGPAGDELAAIAEQTLALAAMIDGDYDAALEHARSSRRVTYARRLPTRGFLIPDVWEATSLVNLDRCDDAVAAYRRAGDRAMQRGQVSILVQTHLALGGVHTLVGRWDDAITELETGLRVAEETGNRSHVLGSHALMARLALSRGDRGATESALAAGHHALAEHGHLFGLDVLLWTQALALEADGDPAGALQLLSSVWERTSSLRGVVQYRFMAPDLARLAATSGDAARAAEVAASTEKIAGRTSSPSAHGCAKRARAFATGDPDLLVAAVADYRRSPRRVETAQACEDAGRALVAAGRARDAPALLEEAASVHVECGATGDLARIDALLRACDVRRRRHGPARAVEGWASLSPTERRVVDLVARGLSNPQIATTLYISRRTVETHVAHVFRKLATTNRAHLIAVAIEHLAAEAPDGSLD